MFPGGFRQKGATNGDLLKQQIGIYLIYYIKNNVDAVWEDLVRMVSGIPVPAKTREYAATSQELKTREEIFSAMVVYGFLSCENGKVFIPNKELREQFKEMFQRKAL